eukprot:3941489-Pyramimonas_sp.AAC.1
MASPSSRVAEDEVGPSASAGVHFKFVNISSWSRLTQDFLATQVSSVEGVFFAEHHLKGESKVFTAKKLCRQLRWSPHFQNAVPSLGGGSHGGVCAMVQPGLCI